MKPATERRKIKNFKDSTQLSVGKHAGTTARTLQEANFAYYQRNRTFCGIAIQPDWTPSKHGTFYYELIHSNAIRPA